MHSCVLVVCVLGLYCGTELPVCEGWCNTDFLPIFVVLRFWFGLAVLFCALVGFLDKLVVRLVCGFLWNWFWCFRVYLQVLFLFGVL